MIADPFMVAGHGCALECDAGSGPVSALKSKFRSFRGSKYFDEEQDPDPHKSEKLDPDPDPH
jgi:hypothetical protein